MRLNTILRRSIAALALAVATPLVSGCVEQFSYIAHGEPFSTGDPKYDEFFSAVRKVRAEALEAEVDERSTRAPLLGALGLEDKATADAAVNEAEARAKKLRDAGVLLHLELVPDAKLFTEHGKTAPDAESKSLLEAIEKTAQGAIALSKRLDAITTRTGELEKVRVKLREEMAASFRGETSARRNEILQELNASQDVLTDSAEQGKRYAALASKFAIDLARAVETGAKGGAGGKAAPGRGAPWKRPAGAGARGPGPARPAAPPPAATPKKPKASDDFEP